MKTKAAIARDNADQVLREKISDYRDNLSGLRSDVQQLQMVATQALQTAQQATQAANAATIASQALAEEIRHIRADVDRRFSESAQANQMERLLGPLADLRAKVKLGQSRSPNGREAAMVANDRTWKRARATVTPAGGWQPATRRTRAPRRRSTRAVEAVSHC